MKLLLSRESIATIVLLMLLSLNAIAGMTILVSATTAIKDPTVYINGSGSVEITWKSGKSQTYSSNAYANLGGLDTVTITPTHGWYIDAVLIDENPQEILDEDGFSLINVKAKSMVSVTFLENGGIDDVETGSNVEAYPDPDVGLIFDDVLVNGFAYAYTIGLPHPDQISETWDIQTDAIFDQSVTVILVLNLVDLGGSDPTALRLFRTEYELARADVNLDGKVDGTDVSIVANSNPSELGDPEYDPRLDLNDNGVIDDDDVNIVNNYVGESVWEPLESRVFLDNDLVYVYGVTDHLSLFGVHKN
ncbi:MAG: hypothetical protein NWE91_09355 [Candidatus Bathyarchaeota archaeon]|nr:hypothetical protein [Candidatus Bathyarchaeota archaeon]